MLGEVFAELRRMLGEKRLLRCDNRLRRPAWASQSGFVLQECMN